MQPNSDGFQHGHLHVDWQMVFAAIGNVILPQYFISNFGLAYMCSGYLFARPNIWSFY